MPCWNVIEFTTTTLDNVGSKDKDRLTAAARECGASLYFYGDTAVAERAGWSQGAELPRKIMQGYARLTIEAGAKKFGLKLKRVEKATTQKKTVRLTVGR